MRNLLHTLVFSKKTKKCLSRNSKSRFPLLIHKIRRSPLRISVSSMIHFLYTSKMYRVRGIEKIIQKLPYILHSFIKIKVNEMGMVKMYPVSFVLPSHSFTTILIAILPEVIVRFFVFRLVSNSFTTYFTWNEHGRRFNSGEFPFRSKPRRDVETRTKK